MNALDAAILCVIAISALFGVWRGLVKEVLSLVTWIAALVIARLYSDAVSELLVSVIENSGVRLVTAFALIFVFIMMAGTLLNFLLAKLLTLTGLLLFDRILGVVFGVARGLVIVLVGIFVATPFAQETPLWQESQLIPYGLAVIERSRLFIEDYNQEEPAT